MKYILALIIALCWLLATVHGNNRRAQVKDSLLRIYLSTPTDSIRLKTLHQIALLDQLSPTFIYYENKLLEEATALKNIYYQSAAIYGHIIYYYNKLDYVRMGQWLYKLQQLAEKHNFYQHYFIGKKMMIELHIVNQKLELALQQAQDMYEKAKALNHRDGMREAYLCLMTVYFNSLLYNEGIECLNKAIELITPDDPLTTRNDLLTKAVLAYSHLNDNENMFIYLEKLKNLKEELQQGSSTLLTNAYIHLYLLLELEYSLYYTRAQNPEKAWEYLQQAEEYLNPSSFLPYRLIRLVAYTEYYQLIKDYNSALTYLDEAIKLVTPFSMDDALMYSLQKADILVNMNRPEEALSVYRQTTRAKDSLFTAFSTSQIEQIQTLHNIETLIVQKERRQTLFLQVCLIIIISIIAVLLIFNLYVYRNRKRLQQDENEMRKLAGIAEEANEVKSRFLANMSYNIRIPLNNVVGFSQLLSTENSLNEKERKEYSHIIQTNSNELIQLVNDVLDLSRLEAKMMKFQLQDCNVEEWCNDLSSLIQMRSEGYIRLKLQVEAENVYIHTDVNRLTQVVTSMLLYPDNRQEPREIKMTLVNQPDKGIIVCRIENSPLADPQFTFQKVSIQQKINQLFFEHFGGTYQEENSKEAAVAVLIFTYPTLS